MYSENISSVYTYQRGTTSLGKSDFGTQPYLIISTGVTFGSTVDDRNFLPFVQFLPGHYPGRGRARPRTAPTKPSLASSMLFPLVCENGSPVPVTPGNDKRRGKRKPSVLHTPGAALLTDAANVYVLSKYSEALVADIETKSFHKTFGKDRTYQKLCVTPPCPWTA